jgi:hypothetical protein
MVMVANEAFGQSVQALFAVAYTQTFMVTSIDRVISEICG